MRGCVCEWSLHATKVEGNVSENPSESMWAKRCLADPDNAPGSKAGLHAVRAVRHRRGRIAHEAGGARGLRPQCLQPLPSSRRPPAAGVFSVQGLGARGSVSDIQLFESTQAGRMSLVLCCLCIKPNCMAGKAASQMKQPLTCTMASSAPRPASRPASATARPATVAPPTAAAPAATATPAGQAILGAALQSSQATPMSARSA